MEFFESESLETPFRLDSPRAQLDGLTKESSEGKLPLQ